MITLFDNEAKARDQALALADGQALPFTVRSLTAAEIARIDGRAPAVMVGIYAAFAVPLFAILALSGAAPPGEIAVAAGVAVLLGGIVSLIARRRARGRSGYRDPNIVLEVGPEDMTLRTPGRIETLGYSDAQVALSYVTMRGSPYFLGLVLDTAIGPLRIDDTWFKPGRTAAAALLGRIAADGVPLRTAR